MRVAVDEHRLRKPPAVGGRDGRLERDDGVGLQDVHRVGERVADVDVPDGAVRGHRGGEHHDLHADDPRGLLAGRERRVRRRRRGALAVVGADARSVRQVRVGGVVVPHELVLAGAADPDLAAVGQVGHAPVRVQGAVVQVHPVPFGRAGARVVEHPVAVVDRGLHLLHVREALRKGEVATVGQVRALDGVWVGDADNRAQRRRRRRRRRWGGEGDVRLAQLREHHAAVKVVVVARRLVVLRAAVAARVARELLARLVERRRGRRAGHR